MCVLRRRRYLQEEIDFLKLLSDLVAGALLGLAAILLGLALVHDAALHLAAQARQLLLQLPLAALQPLVTAAQALQCCQLLLQLPVHLLQPAAARRLLLQLQLQLVHLRREHRPSEGEKETRPNNEAEDTRQWQVYDRKTVNSLDIQTI